MKIGKIDYLNLLPFDVFAKQHLKPYEYRYMMHFKSYPSRINQDFLRHKIDAAFISSIMLNHPKLKSMHLQGKPFIGIIAKGAVDSVLVIPGNEYQNDHESNTSNALAKILNIQGQVIIGDKALKLCTTNRIPDCKDLSLEWYKRYKAPFAFAVFCTNHRKKRHGKICKAFTKHSKKVPYYILKKASSKVQLSSDVIKTYLKKIHYNGDLKVAKSLKRFLRLSQHIP